MPDDTRSKEAPSSSNQTLIPRRSVLQYGATAIAVATLPGLGGCAAEEGTPHTGEGSHALAELDASALASALTVTVLRKQDMTVLELAFVNLDLRNKNTQAPPAGLALAGDLWLGRTDLNAAAYIVTVFQPQHFLEETFKDDAAPAPNGQPPGALGVRHRMSEASRLAFRIPPGVNAIAYELDVILAELSKCPLNVVATATPQAQDQLELAIEPIFFAILSRAAAVNTNLKAKNAMRAGRALQASANYRAANPEVKPQPVLTRAGGSDEQPPILNIAPQHAVKPNQLQTAIELPFRLQISPNTYARFEHAAQPAFSAKTGRVELWHTRLQTPQAWQKTIRAVWTRDPGFLPNKPDESFAGETPPFPVPMVKQDRADIVHLTTNLSLEDDHSKPRARAVPTKSLMLSALGGWLESNGAWNWPYEGQSVTPEKDKVTSSPAGKPSLLAWDHTAGLGRDQYVRIVRAGYLYPFGHRAVWVKITERKIKSPWNIAYLFTKEFIVVHEPVKAYDDLPAGTQRGFPFKAIRLKTITTPLLEPRAPLAAPAAASGVPCPLNAQGTPFRFEMQGFDWDGNAHDFTSPCVWVDSGDAVGEDAYARLAKFQGAIGDQFRKVAMCGQRVAMAESEDVDDTRYAMASMLPTGAIVPGVAPFFRPHLEQADLAVDAVRGLTGTDAASTFTYNANYIDNGFNDPENKNPGKVFMQLTGVSADLELADKSDRSGGFVAPSLEVGGLSRAQGIVGGDADAFGKGQSTPKTFFPEFGAKLFGVLDLSDIIAGFAGKLFEQTPKFAAKAMQLAEEAFQIIQSASQLGSELSGALVSMQSAIDYLPPNPWEVSEKSRMKSVAEDSALSEVERALILRVWSKAAALAHTKLAMTDFVADLGARAGALVDQGKAVADVLDQLTQLGPNTNFDALAADASIAVGSAAAALSTLADEFTVNALPVDDGLRLQIGKLSTKLATIVSGGELSAAITAFIKAQDAIKNLHVKLDWAPELKPWPADAAIFWPNDTRGLRVGVEARGKASGGSAPGVEVFASLTDFELRLIGSVPFLKLVFDKLIFKAGTAGKPEVDCVFRGLHFGGPLEFIEVLREFIPLDGFSDPPNVLVDENGLSAKFTLPLPNIALGVFSLENLAFSAGFVIPFIGDSLAVSFAFCSREEPFVLTVSMLGGGGFVGIEIAPDGMRKLEISLEARASLSVDFGVASGSIAVSLGIYFCIEMKNEVQSVTLSGYVRMRGEVDVLGGLISASIELYLSLTYEKANGKPGKVTGHAKIEISISVFFFSGTITVEAERRFSGSNADPTFRELMAPGPEFAPWEEYCTAFAPAA